jgi:hypothetical protein
MFRHPPRPRFHSAEFLYRSSNLTPRITRRAAPLMYMTSLVSAVGCMRLFGGDAASRARGARNARYSPLAHQPGESHHAPPARRSQFPTPDSASTLSASCSARSRRTPRITRRAALLLYMRAFVSAVGCMRLLGGGQSLSGRGAHNARCPPDTSATRELSHARHTRRNCFFAHATRPANLCIPCSATSRPTPRITRPQARWSLMTSLVSRVACMRLLGGAFILNYSRTPRFNTCRLR